MTDTPQSETRLDAARNWITMIEHAVFAVRWMLLPLYIGLIATLGFYIAHFLHEVYEMAWHFFHYTKEQNILLLLFLELLDMTLISQLGVMTIQGGYAIFIHPLDRAGFNLPQWLKHGLSTYDQKIKMGMSIMLIMTVQILDMFIKREGFTQADLYMREQMLACAVIVTIAFCVINRLQHPAKPVPAGDKDAH